MEFYGSQHLRSKTKLNAMKKIITVLVLVMASLGYVLAQERTITGTVTAANDGSPIPGVNVVLKGTKKGTTTDTQGKYSLTVPSKSTLVFSFIGYINKEVAIGINNVINVSLAIDAAKLEEVVVVGYSVQQKKSITGSVNSIKSKSIRPSQLASPMYADYEQQTNWNTEGYNSISENIFHDALNNPLSTFSIDVDAASYSNMRRFISNGQRPPKDAVRIEEMINYFDYDYEQPAGGDDPFSIYTEISSAPWNSKHKLVHIGLQGKKIPTANLPASNLVFLIDVSGSMSDENKLPLLKRPLNFW